MQVRTRFAPSPTGYLHIGGVRTALFSWAYAKRYGGKFILRIEDTDLERSNAESVQTILGGMKWLNLDWDEGPFYQMERMERYKQVIQQLLDEDKAYKCYCSKDRLQDLREKQMEQKIKPKYDGLCRTKDPKDPNRPYVIRFKNPQEGEVVFQDAVQGEIRIKNSELDDLIIARSDGTPTYNFTVVVDDMDMRMTHVIRGADHINNTPRQINLLRALGYEPPVYAHVPMILDVDGRKLSKRHGAASVLEYKDEGYLPEAVINYLVRLGWSHGDQEIFSMDEIVEYFEISRVNRAAASLNPDKLNWLNQHYMKTLDPYYVAEALLPHLEELAIDVKNGPDITKVIAVLAERSHTLKELAEKSSCFYKDITEYSDKAKKQLVAKNVEPLAAVKERLKSLTNWEKESIHAVIVQVAEELDMKLGKVAQPIRAAITGDVVSPPIDITLELIGQKRSIDRIEQALLKVM
ncbi:MAG: glutamate--tRNA ligase [Gammaproteobacteria bacterium]|nr:glutamate--tRNA ligase [Gammaproteobacteria bacterium]